MVMITGSDPNVNNLIEEYLKTNIDKINLTNHRGWTALMLACRNSCTYSSVATVDILLRYGADINIQDRYGWTALMKACCYSDTEANTTVVKKLLDRGAMLIYVIKMAIMF